MTSCDADRMPKISWEVELRSIMQTPRSLLDVFKNINKSFQKSLVVRDEFFLDDGLKYVFGAKTVKFRNTINKSKMINIKAHLTGFFDVVASNECDIPAVESIEFSSIVILRSDGNTISYTNLENIFDKKLEIDNTYLSATSEPVTPRTSQYGNEKYRYIMRNERLNGRFIFDFFHDGTLRNAVFRAQEI